MIALTDKVKENPKGFFKYIKSKRIIRERVGSLKDQCVILITEQQETGKVNISHLYLPWRRHGSLGAREIREDAVIFFSISTLRKRTY